jgi:transposase
MPRPHPPEFRSRSVELARQKDKPIAQIAVDLGISESCCEHLSLHAAQDAERRAAADGRSAC